MCECGETKRCKACRARELGKARTFYRFTPELRARLAEAYASPRRQELTKALDRLVRETGWPRFAFTQAAERQGLVTVTLRRWTRAEDEHLEEHAGSVSLVGLARQLKRSERSVDSRLQRLQLSRARSEGYHIRDLAECFGVTPQRVQRWFDRGLFGKVHALGGVNGKRVTEANVEAFIRRHHGEYDMRRVDQVWFKAMVFRGAECRDGR
jgi:transposase-like protein